MNQTISYSLIIPIYNGATFFASKISDLRDWLAAEPNREIIIVNDGSVDGTEEILAGLKTETGFTIINHSLNQGKGAALRSGLVVARGQVVGFTDADLPYGLNILTTMGQKLVAKPNLAMVYGSRGHEQSGDLKNYGWLRRVGRKFFSILIKKIAVSSVTDSQCGVKVFTDYFVKDLVKYGQINRFAFDIELFVIAKAKGYFYEDFPVVLGAQKESSVRLVVDTLRMLKDLIVIKARLRKGEYT